MPLANSLRSSRVKSRLLVVIACCAVLTACHSLSMPKVWPFYKKPKPVPEAVNEVNLVLPDGTAANYPQYWKRNTLVVDFVTMGELFQNNHHKYGQRANFANRWFEVDPTFAIMKVLAWMRIIHFGKAERPAELAPQGAGASA